MIVVFLCCMMKLVEFSVGKPASMQRRRRFVRRRAKGMNEVGLKGSSLSPDSDCNSNVPNSSSYLSVSSQDVDFIQDNSDYQWFLDYGYRENNHHTSILSLPESYEAGDVHYYETMAKNMDANLAEADMDTFRTEDIHALLTNLPPMCQDHLSHEGECYASVSGSMMAKFAFDSSSSPHSSSHDSTSMSICKSELLFSPVKEVPVPGGNFSVDSLDCDFHDMMLTCQANKDNYTIAFEGSCTMYSEESDFHTTDKSSANSASETNWNDMKKLNLKKKSIPMTQSDSGSFTTWSKLNKRSDSKLTGNNNGSGDATNLGLNDNSLKSQSMPNLYKKKLKMVANLSQSRSNTPSDVCTIKRKPVKVFDIQHHSSSGSGKSLSDMATSVDTTSSDNSTKPNFNLVKLFMKQKSVSTEGMSTTADQLSSTEWPPQLEESTRLDTDEHKCHYIPEEPEDENLHEEKSLNNNRQPISRSIQTSHFSEILNLKNTTKPKQQPIKVIEPSFLSKLKLEGEVQKPVYVLYPNYVLPNLDFLNEKQPDAKVLLMPQRTPSAVPKRRPFSCNDLEVLKRKGFSHIKDWDSLNFLLPQDCKEILRDVPEISEYMKKRPRLRRRPMSCDYSDRLNHSSSSTATQPSSGYRGSSTILDCENSPAPHSNLNPLFVYRYDSVTSSEASLRLSKPKISMQDRIKKLSETEDEGVDAGTSSSSLDEHEAKLALPEMSVDELLQFEEYLKLSGISSSDPEDLNEESLTQLRSYVSKFLTLKMNQEGGEHFGGKKTVTFAEKVDVLRNNSPNVSALGQYKNYQIHPKQLKDTDPSKPYNVIQKWSLVNAVTSAVDQLTKHFSSATNEAELLVLGDSNLSPACAKIALNSLCPALYAILSDGLKPNLETSFGPVENSVWQVVEASAKQGPLTKALNELVMRVNAEDAITEGLVKFNTFVFGLLNVRSLDAWASYLKTRESIIKKHYEADSFLMLTHTGGSNIRALMDKLITALQPLAVYPFQLDLFYEYRQLHMSFKRMDSYQQALSPTHKLSFSHPKQWSSPGISEHSEDSEETSAATVRHRPSDEKKERPRSCCDPGFRPNFKLGEDVTSIAKKRWSGIQINSKLYQVYDRLAREDDEEYTDSLENKDHSDDNMPDIEPDQMIGKRFKKLQQKWEMMSSKDVSPTSSPGHTRSRIPRLITSPVKPSGIPVPKKATTPPGGKNVTAKVNSGRVPAKKVPTRTSRMDQLEGAENQTKKTRPSSLPYKAGPQKSSKIPPRRAASSSLNRKPLSVASKTPKVVKTLSHRLPSESGHLSYNEGENLRVILKVDDKWLLCCRGNQKGLVPIASVISADVHF